MKGVDSEEKSTQKHRHYFDVFIKICSHMLEYERNELEEYIANARELLFSNLKFVLEPENVNGRKNYELGLVK